jgi:hypothetical protein
MIPALDALFAAAARGMPISYFLPTLSQPLRDLQGSIQHIILGSFCPCPFSLLLTDDLTLTGMPHRGRLNLLTDLLQFPPTALFHKIKGGYEIPEELGVEGDVLSHLGQSFVFFFCCGHQLISSLVYSRVPEAPIPQCW